MPHIFLLFKEILNIDIGTIVVYTCEKSCNNPNIEEYAFIQRTGDKILELEPDDKPIKKEIIEEEFSKDLLNKLTVRGNTDNTPDDEGFIEVKKKKK
jgi:hypothetical protein